MFSSKFPQEFQLATYSTPTNAVPPLMMMMYGLCPKPDTMTFNYSQQQAIAASPLVYQNPYAYPVINFDPSPSVKPEEMVMEDQFEVLDSFLKTPVFVRPNVVYPSKGSQELFSTQRKNSNMGTGTRNTLRVCESFQEGFCLLGENCCDVHVFPEYLMATRQSMIKWLECREREFQQNLLIDPGRVFQVFCADLKEVVEVPISALRFTRGLYVDPSIRARRTRGGHQRQFAMIASQVPTACGLFSVDPVQCKWGRWCNQVHIDAAWMHSKKSEFESWFNNLERRFNNLPSNHEFAVHDPQLKMCLSLPKASIAAFSRGLFQGSATKAPSVCMLFQRNRCTASTCCNQIHVVPSYLQLHRQWIRCRDRLSEEEQKIFLAQMGAMLELLSRQPGREVSIGDNTIVQAKELNPQAEPYIPSPPPQDVGKRRGGTMKDEGTKEDTCDTVGDEYQIHSSLSYQQIQICPDEVVPMEQSFLNQSVKLTECRSTSLQQQQNYPMSNSPTMEISGNHCRTQKNTSSGCVVPLGEFMTVFDGDERSQSSLQASHSNISNAGRSYKHTNNPYTLGGSTSCTAPPNFGWVQPVRSAGNSCTTATVSCVGGEGGGGGGGWGLRSKVDSSSVTNEMRSTLYGLQQHELDTNSRTSPPSFHWNN